MAEAPKIPTPDKIMEVTNKHVAQSLDLINTQMADATTTLGLPSPPTLPKFALPTLPKMGEGVGALPTLPFLPTAAPAKRGEERIAPPAVPTGAIEIVA